MRIAIHQPDYFPWMGFFAKARQCDALILLNTAQFTRGGYTNRVQVKGSKGPIWLTQPVKRGKTDITDLEFADFDWRTRHIKTLQMNYAKSPNFKRVMEQVECLFRKETDSLDEMNSHIIKYLFSQMDISCQISHAHAFPSFLKGTERLVELIKKAYGGPSELIYVSGNGGHNYMDLSVFEENGIGVEFTKFVENPYPQQWGGYIPGLSCLDSMFNGACEGYHVQT